MNGARLRELRQERGLTRKQVEEATGIDRGTIQYYEEGRVCDPGVVKVAALAKFFGVSVEELLKE